MYKRYKIIHLIIICFLVIGFSGCSNKNIYDQNLIVHKQTIQEPIKYKEKIFQVNNIVLKGDLANSPLFDFFKIESKDIKFALENNIKQFYKLSDSNSSNEDISIDVNMSFKLDGLVDICVETNSTYSLKNEISKIVIPIDTNFTTTYNLTARKFFGAIIYGLGTGRHIEGIESNKQLKYETLEKTAYASNKNTPLTAFNGAIRKELAYSSAIRLNIAKFLQKLETIDLKNFNKRSP